MRFTKGINQDVDPSAQPEGTYRDLINGVLNDKTGSIVKDLPTQEIVDLASGDVEIKGSVTVSERDRIILFLYSNSSNDSRIINVDLNTNTKSNILTDDPQDQSFIGDLNFDQSSYVDATYSINNNDELIIYWTDGVNPPRFYNVDKGKDTNENAINIFPHYNSSNNQSNVDFSLSEIKKSGGFLSGGSYQLAFAYIDNDGLLTNYFYVTQPIRIKRQPFDYKYIGLSDEDKTSNAIEFTLSNLDTNYERLRITAIKGTNVGNVTDINIPSNGNISYTYTGGEDEIAGSIDEIAIDQPSYDAANTMTQYNNQLYMGGVEKSGLSKSEKEDLQSAALDINVSADFIETEPQSGGRSAINLDKPGFKRGEVYALYISFLRNDGRETEAFHIPGRPPTIGNEKDSYSNSGASFDDRYKALAEPDNSNNMGYWENEGETYPQTEPFISKTTTDINGDSVNYSDVAVRHHRVPGPTYLDRPSKPSSPSRKANVFGFNITNVSVPSNLSDKIVGYKIYYAKKEDQDRLIIDQGAFNPGWLDKEPVWSTDNYSFAVVDEVNFDDNNDGSDDIQVDILDDGTKVVNVTLSQSDSFSQTATKIRDAINNAGFSKFSASLKDDGEGVEIYYTNIYNPDEHTFSAIPTVSVVDTNDSVFVGGRSAFNEPDYPDGYRPFQNGNKIFKGDPIYSSFGFDSLHEHDSDGNSSYEGEQWGSDTSIAYGRPAYSMINRPEISGISHLKAVEAIEYNHEPPFESQYSLENAISNRTKVLGPHESGGEDDDWFLNVKAGPVYIEKNQRNVNISDDFNFLYDMDNLFGESKIVIEINGGDLRRGYRTIFDMCVTQDTVHSPYDRQELVDTSEIGYVDSNGDGETKTFRNGDTFISRNSYKTNTPLALLNGEEDNNDDDGWNNAFDEYWISDISDVLEVTEKSDSAELKGTRFGIQEEIGSVGNINITPFPVGHKYDSFVESRIPCGLIADGDGKYEKQEPVPDANDLEPSSNEYDTSNSPPAKQIIISRRWSRHFIESDNYPVWNEEYAKLNTIRSAFPWDPYDIDQSSYYNRVIRSSGDSDSGRSESFRRFLEEDYIDVKEDRGEVVNLTEFKDNLIIHLERSLIQTRGQERMQTSEGQNVFIGNGNIFNVEPSEIKTTELGYAGLESFKAQSKCEFGYFFVDKDANSIYWLSQSNGFNELTTEQFGLSEFFDERLRSDKEPRIGYDPDGGRVMFTFYDTSNNNDHNTISFYPTRSAWGSRHSYHPDKYVDLLDTLATIKDDKLYFHTENGSGIYGINRLFEFKYAVPHGFNHKIDHVWVNADDINSGGSITEDQPIDLLEVENSHQTTGNITLNPYDSGTPTDITDRGNLRKTQGVWRVHDIREKGGGPNYLPDWSQDPKLEDDHHIVSIEKIASDNSIILRAAGVQSEQTIH